MFQNSRYLLLSSSQPVNKSITTTANCDGEMRELIDQMVRMDQSDQPGSDIVPVSNVKDCLHIVGPDILVLEKQNMNSTITFTTLNRSNGT